MKKIIAIHIEHLSDSHFKVTSACLDSLISLISYNSTSVLSKIDSVILKVRTSIPHTLDALPVVEIGIE